MGWAKGLLDYQPPKQQPPHINTRQEPVFSASDIPSLCQDTCLQAYTKTQQTGKQPLLCQSPGSDFRALHSNCKTCCARYVSNVDSLERANKALYEKFGTYLDYCEALDAFAVFTPDPVAVGSAATTGRVYAATELAVVTATFTVTTQTVGIRATGVGVVVEGGDDGGQKVNTGVIVGVVVGVVIAVIVVAVMGVLFLRGRYKRRVKALGKDRGGSSSGGSSTTIGNDVGVVEVENKEMVIAELDGTPVVKRAEMDVEGGYKELDVEFGYGELDVMEKRLSEKEERYGVDREEIKQSSNKERDEREDEENADDAGGMVGKEERVDQNGGQTTKSKRTSADIAQVEKITYQTSHER